MKKRKTRRVVVTLESIIETDTPLRELRNAWGCIFDVVSGVWYIASSGVRANVVKPEKARKR